MFLPGKGLKRTPSWGGGAWEIGGGGQSLNKIHCPIHMEHFGVQSDSHFAYAIILLHWQTNRQVTNKQAHMFYQQQGEWHSGLPLDAKPIFTTQSLHNCHAQLAAPHSNQQFWYQCWDVFRSVTYPCTNKVDKKSLIWKMVWILFCQRLKDAPALTRPYWLFFCKECKRDVLGIRGQKLSANCKCHSPVEVLVDSSFVVSVQTFLPILWKLVWLEKEIYKTASRQFSRGNTCTWISHIAVYM